MYTMIPAIKASMELSKVTDKNGRRNKPPIRAPINSEMPALKEYKNANLRFLVAENIGMNIEKPSGILWIAIATANNIPRFNECMAPVKVANPSGKLCIVIPIAVRRPIFMSLGFLLGVFSAMYSWGIDISIKYKKDMPAIKYRLANEKPTKSMELPRSSTKDICNMTPAEKLKENQINFSEGFLMNNAKRAPIVVAMPAKNDNNRA